MLSEFWDALSYLSDFFHIAGLRYGLLHFIHIFSLIEGDNRKGCLAKINVLPIL